MGVLKNARHEAFAQNLIRGTSQVQAYMDVYPSSRKWKRASLDVKASALANSASVKARIRELQDASAKDAVATLQEIQEYLTKVVRGEVDDAAVTAQGVVLVPVKVKDRNKAAEELGKMLGGYETNVNLSADMDLNINIDYGENDESDSSG